MSDEKRVTMGTVFPSRAGGVRLECLKDVLAYVKGATLEGVRGVYDQGGVLKPVAFVFYGGDHVRVDPFDAQTHNSIAGWMKHLRDLAAKLKAQGVAVTVESDAGVLVVLEHRELARDVMWWAALLPKTRTLGAWEERMGSPAGTGPWSVLRGVRGGQA